MCHNPDPLADVSRMYIPYVYCYGNPVRMVDPDGMLAGPTHLPSQREMQAQQRQFVSDWNNSMGHTDGFGNPVEPGADIAMALSRMDAVVEQMREWQNQGENNVQVGELSEDDVDNFEVTVTPELRSVLDYIYDKEGRKYEDQLTHPSTDQPTKFGIDMASFIDKAKSYLGIDPTLDNLKNLTSDQADQFTLKRYFVATGIIAIENFSILKALGSQAVLGQTRVLRNTRKSLNSVLGLNIEVNPRSLSVPEVKMLNNLNSPQTSQFLNSFIDLQIQSYLNLSDRFKLFFSGVG